MGCIVESANPPQHTLSRIVVRSTEVGMSEGMGEHTAEVLRTLTDLTPEEIATLSD
jgi:hypothetical protein